MAKDSYEDLCLYLEQEVNYAEALETSKYWTTVAFSNGSGDSKAVVDQIFVIRFGQLSIKLYTLSDKTV